MTGVFCFIEIVQDRRRKKMEATKTKRVHIVSTNEREASFSSFQDYLDLLFRKMPVSLKKVREKCNSISLIQLKERVDDLNKVVDLHGTAIDLKYSNLLLDGLKILQHVSEIEFGFDLEQRVQFTHDSVTFYFRDEEKEEIERYLENVKIFYDENKKQDSFEYTALYKLIKVSRNNLKKELEIKEKRIKELESLDLRQLQTFNYKMV